jgi:YidC/Oxa1 family membrane protein insertase
MNHYLSLKNIRTALYIALFIVASILFMKWQALNAPAPVAATPATSVSTSANGVATLPGNVSLAVTPAANTNPVVVSAAPFAPNLITVDTPLMQVKINPVGGNIVYAVLKNYKQSMGSNQPFLLLNQDPNSLYYIIESGLVTGDNSLPTNMTFSSPATSYTLGDQNQLTINLTWNNAGLSLIKSYTFFPGVYTVNVAYQIANHGQAVWSGRFYGELTRNAPLSEAGMLNSYTSYTGAAISSPTNHYQKIKFADMVESNLSQTVSSGWVAMLQHYFITAFVPAPNTAVTQFSAVNQGLYSIGLANPTVTVAPGASATTGAAIYLGPAITNQLSVVAPYLAKTIDYGWLWFISGPIFVVMQWIHSYVNNWGFAIILVTCLIKLIFFPLSAKSYLSMAKMRELQPKIKELREKIGDDRQKLGVATMELYRKEKVNPLGGCLPIVVQIPVFIALYWVLMESVELRQAPFIFWIHDLSIRDPFFILPVLMGISMFIQQRLNPAPPDPMQAKIMMFLPLVFTIMFLSFPSGLVLYWLVNQILSILQQWWVMSRYHKKMAKKRRHLS